MAAVADLRAAQTSLLDALTPEVFREGRHEPIVAHAQQQIDVLTSRATDALAGLSQVLNRLNKA